MILKCKAPAKINLYLDIISKRENDGYHNLESIMHSVSLCDEISIDVKKSDEFSISILCSDKYLPSDEKNLAYRAAKAYFKASGIKSSYSISIQIDKKIPVEAGLGGGSTDAAAVIRLLNIYFENKLTDEKLNLIGASIGADVPFCISGNTASAHGIGEIVEPILCPNQINFVIAIGKERVSTPSAFNLIDLKFGTEPSSYGRLEQMKSAVSSGNISAISDNLYNKFESVIIPRCDSVSELKSCMNRSGALSSLMSGSGSSVFGIFESYHTAAAAAEKLRDIGFSAFPCQSFISD